MACFGGDAGGGQSARSGVRGKHAWAIHHFEPADGIEVDYRKRGFRAIACGDVSALAAGIFLKCSDLMCNEMQMSHLGCSVRLPVHGNL